MYSVPYLTLTAGDKGIKCPSGSPKQCRKGPLGAPPFATMAILSASHATAHRWLHSLPPRAPGEAPRATRWWMRWSVGTEWPPAAASALPLLLSCRVRKVVAHRASRYLGWSSRQAPLAGALLPCRRILAFARESSYPEHPTISSGELRRASVCVSVIFNYDRLMLSYRELIFQFVPNVTACKYVIQQFCSSFLLFD